MEGLPQVYDDDEVQQYIEECIAITINPDPKRYTSYDPEDQYRSLIQTLLSHPQMRHTFKDYAFYPELTLEGNVHLHGHYRIKDQIKYYKWFLPLVKRIAPSGYRIKKNIDTGWFEYETKFKLAQEFFEPLPVPYTEYSHVFLPKRPKYHVSLKKERVKKRVTDYF